MRSIYLLSNILHELILLLDKELIADDIKFFWFHIEFNKGGLDLIPLSFSLCAINLFNIKKAH